MSVGDTGTWPRRDEREHLFRGQLGPTVIEVPKRPFDAQVMMQSIRLLRSLGRAVGKPQSLLKFEIELTRGTGLFDREFYLSQIDPAELDGMSALKHYVLHGDARGLWPSPMFDVPHYDAQCGKTHGLNRLLHYGLIARFRGVSPSPWFDAEYYLRCNPDVTQSGMDPLRHFQRWGWREGRNPLPGLDIRRLMNTLPEMQVVKGAALSVFATDAVARHMEGASSRQSGYQSRSATPAPGTQRDLLASEFWSGIEARRWSAPVEVDVVIPVYGGLEETLACLHSVLTAPVRTPHEVVVINDASPIPELGAMLRTLAARGLITLEVNRQNQGFVRSVNKGMRQHRERDVVLLNSDTEVYGDWLDRLVAQAEAHPRAATITPLSNNATICSYPETLGDNRLSLEVSHAEIDRIAASVNRLKQVEAPTGVGFCMYLRRAALRQVGLFDDRRFGRGYGEENDFCQRALQAGWTNALACDVYVRHVGSVSFKGEAAARIAAAIKKLERLYPDYNHQVARHIEADPAWVYRARIDLGRLQRLTCERNVLLVCHNRGGGTERHLLEQTQQLLAQGVGVFELRPSHQAGCVALLHPGMFGLHNLATLPLGEGGLFDEAIALLGITELHVHHLIDFPAETAQALASTARRLGLTLRVSVHDYYTICPRVNLVKADGRYCGQPADADCDQCLGQDHLNHQTGAISQWRARFEPMLQQAQHVLVPADDVARRVMSRWPALRIAVRPHEPDPPRRVSASPLVPLDLPVRVMVVGAISPIKGFRVLHGVAASARSRGLPLALSLLGYSCDDSKLAAEGVRLLGRYFDNELMERINAADPHVLLVPSIWPETYCYALSGALRSGRRVAVFDLGAQADRARRHDPHHLVLPLSLADRPDALADVLLQSARAPGLDLLERAPNDEQIRVSL